MEKQNVQVIYDKEEDLLSLFRKDKKSKFSYDIELPDGDIVVDFGFDGQIIGLEFFNASKYFKDVQGMKDNSEIKGSFNVNYGNNWARINYIMQFPNVQYPIVSFVPAPYNKKLILEH